MSFSTLAPIIDAMATAVERLKVLQQVKYFTLALTKFESMPSLEISPDLDVTSLIEQVGTNSNEIGTILQSNGSPVAVIFSTEQFQTVSGILNLIPAVIKNIQDGLKHRIEFSKKLQEMSIEIFNEAGAVLLTLPHFILIGTVVTVAGTIMVTATFYNRKMSSNEHRFRQEPRPKVEYFLPGLVLAAGIGLLGFSAYKSISASSSYLAVVKVMGSVTLN